MTDTNTYPPAGGRLPELDNHIFEPTAPSVEEKRLCRLASLEILK